MTTSIRFAVAVSLVVPMSCAFGQDAVTADSPDAAVQAPAAIEAPVASPEPTSAEPAAPIATATAASTDAGVDVGVEAAAPAVEKSRRGGRLIEEIIVTAQKREEKLMEVPVSVQAFSAASLEARGITDTSGLMKATPGLDIGTQAGFTSLFLRGIGTEAWLTADPSIASYVDGVYFSFAPSIVQDFGGVERVEVLKGPQGTLFGRNAVGGAINVITKAPSFNTAETEIATSYGSFNSLRTTVYTNVPFTDNFAVAVGGAYNKADSFLGDKGSTNGGKDLNQEISKGIRIKARWSPVDEADITLTAVRSHAQNNGAYPVNSKPSPLGLALGVPAAGKYKGATDETLYLNNDMEVLSGQVIYNFPWINVKLLASDQYNSQPYNYDFDGSERPLVSFDIPVHYGKVQEAELQFLSNEGSFGSDWLTFAAGVFFYKNEQGFDPIEVTVAGGLDPSDLQAIGIDFGPDPLGLEDALETTFGPIRDDLPLYRVSNTALIETDSLSEYAQATVRFSDYLSLTVGGRYQDEDRGVKESNTNLFIAGEVTRAITWRNGRDDTGALRSLKDTTKSFKPKIALDSHPFGDDTLVYASYQEAIKAHAFNAYAIYLPPAYVKPEETTAYEIGLKTTLFEGTTALTAAAFWYDIDELQTQFVSLVNGGAVSFENAGTARSRGFDFDITAELFPSLIEGLAGSLNASFLDAKYRKYVSGSGYNLTTGIFSSNNDYSGNEITRTPKVSSTATLTKTFYIATGTIEIGGDVYYNDGFFYTASNDPRLLQKAYTLVGARLSYFYEPWNLRTTIFGKNITDSYYTAGTIATDFGSNLTVSPPRQIGLKIDLRF